MVRLRSDMTMPTSIDPEAVRLFEEADWAWNDNKKAFIEARQPNQESTADYRSRLPGSVGYGELRDHGLAGTTSAPNRDKGLAWLRRRLISTSKSMLE